MPVQALLSHCDYDKSKEMTPHDQLSKIIEAGEKDQVTVRVIPFDASAYAATESNFVLFEFDEPSLSPVIYVEGLTGSRLIDREADVDRYRGRRSICVSRR